ncbi:MAG: PQQ-binding-like beta-propeller repeat protein [Lentisphaerae bacterium]|nr:PQQ-binding-like beta-propeller repeat protein [Lentisphaerota bacterium]
MKSVWQQIRRWSLVAVLGVTAPALASDWPMQRKDAARSRVTDETLAFPLQCVWRYIPAQPPQPAWPEPPRLLNQMDFDYAPAPVIAGGILYFGSSADDTVRALDAATGALKWQFTAGGPIRFAPSFAKATEGKPQIGSGSVFFGSDVGRIYCLEAATGKPVWIFNAAPTNEQYIGNRRMISRWPIRTGVLVQDAMVYAVAGIWPSEGIYIYALNADNGAVVWLNDTASSGRGMVAGYGPDYWNINDPHMGEFAMDGLTPQGALLATMKTLVVPQAYNGIAQFNLKGLALKQIGNHGACGSTPFLDGGMIYSLRPGGMLYGKNALEEGVKTELVQLTGTNVLPAARPDSHFTWEERPLKKVDAIVSGGNRYVRKAGGLALAANALLVGQRDEIVAEDLSGAQTLWRAPVRGLAREIAVADGRVYVATDTGEISCFAPKPVATVVHDARAAVQARNPMKLSAKTSAVVAELKRRQADGGVALVLGDADAGLACALAAQTSLHVLNISTNANAVSALRARLVRETAWYGSRIHVIYVPDLRRLPFAQYVANAVIVTDGNVTVSAQELYRLLHPCGGVWLMPGAAERAAALMRAAPNTEYHTEPVAAELGALALVRNSLAGARDWNTQPPSDQRVKWPLRPLWFGGPDATQVMTTDGFGTHPPVAANGRYFVMGEDCLTAVDAYNGMTLWSRLIPPAAANGIPRAYNDQWGPIKRFLAADDRHVYLRLGAGWFQGKGEALIRLDAYSGAQQGLYAPFIAATNIVLTAPQHWVVAWDETHVAKVTLAQQAEGVVLTFTSPEPMAQNLRWDVCLDFRAPDRRYGLYEDGAFALLLMPSGTSGAPASARQVSGPRFPEYTLRGGSRQGASEVTLAFSWRTLEKFAGLRPVSFDLAVGGAWLADQPAVPVAQPQPRYLFGDGVSPRYLNRGWARVILSGVPGAKKPPAILLGEIDQRPKEWRFPDLYDWLTIQHPGALSPVYQTAARRHPLTGEPGLRVYRSGAGYCGFPVYSAHAVVGRTTKTAIGFYDFDDDSGLRMFPGLAANCGVQTKAQNMTAALGLLIFSESRGHCDCMVPIRTTVAFAPAERRLQEDWAIFCERNADAPVRQAALNFGAPGDRRDERGTLWLGYPQRMSGGKGYPREPGSARYVIQSPPISSAINVPLTVAYAPAFRGFQRYNSDRVRIEGTDRPWLYASCMLGATNLTLALEPVVSLVAAAAQTPPALDGLLEPAFWKTNEPPRALAFTRARLSLRFDEKHLYIGAYRLPLVDAKGQAAAWTNATRGEDAPIHQDDNMEFFLSDKANAAVVHLGVSASGARYDALARGREPERAAWNGEWRSGVRADENGFGVELAILWTTLVAAGLDKASLALNMQVNQKNMSAEVPVWAGDLAPRRQEGIGDALLSLGPQGRARCANFVPVGLGQAPVRKPRLFTVRLHFAELDDTAVGQRVFDVKLQGQPALKNFDIVKEAGAPRRALVKEFKQVKAGAELSLEFVPSGKELTSATAPILSGLELYDEDFRRK